MWILILTCLCAAGDASPAPEKSALGPPAERDVLNAVWNALQADPELANQHRGYLRLLEANPGLASAEQPYWDLTTVSGFRSATRDFDEALLRDRAFQGLFDRYYRYLAQHESMREQVDALHRLELGEPQLRRHPAAMLYLRAHPDEAIRFLENPSSPIPMPEALRPLREPLKSNGKLRKELLGHFRGIHEQTAAHTEVFPWWAAAGQENRDGAESYRRLKAYLGTRPHEFWAWHRHAIALAGQPESRDWIRYWERRVRRNADLEWNYTEYLKLIRKRPELGRAASAEWERSLGAAPAWPPKEAPPALAPWPPEKTKETGKAPPVPRPVKPQRPTLQEVPRPKQPDRPVKPTATKP